MESGGGHGAWRDGGGATARFQTKASRSSLSNWNRVEHYGKYRSTKKIMSIVQTAKSWFEVLNIQKCSNSYLLCTKYLTNVYIFFYIQKKNHLFWRKKIKQIRCSLSKLFEGIFGTNLRGIFGRNFIHFISGSQVPSYDGATVWALISRMEPRVCLTRIPCRPPPNPISHSHLLITEE